MFNCKKFFSTNFIIQFLNYLVFHSSQFFSLQIYEQMNPSTSIFQAFDLNFQNSS